MQTITERYDKKHLTIFFVCCFLMLGLIGVVKTVTDDGRPDCYKHFAEWNNGGGEGRNKAVDCMHEIEKWCEKNHPDDESSCETDFYVAGDPRNGSIGEG
ncbi:hypothetical protein ABZT48_02610 [Streptomyces avermitilis]|uniref:hypothetical protein n=1 Tax=Streptomyces avermitilis TaxID=33903 RepID=UPI0033BAEF77